MTLEATSTSYRSAGVDLEAAAESGRRIKNHVQSTFTPAVVSEFGTFGGMFRASWPELRDPILVASIDGVGTKVKLAALANRLNGVGHDIVNHCVNDILVQGARPLFFLDYYGTGKLEPEHLEQVVAGIAEACRANGCAVLGGETAEMPGVYPDSAFDLVGTIVGVVDREQVLDGSRIRVGDVLVGLPSSGLHTNGYSLVRKVLFDNGKYRLDEQIEGIAGSLGDAVLAPHRSYRTVLDSPIQTGMIHGLAHITGGGITDNLPRILPNGCKAVVHSGAWRVPELFRFIQREAGASDQEMLRTFNMGIGMIAVLCAEDVTRLQQNCQQHNMEAVVIGTIEQGASAQVKYSPAS